jgi:hypothetical protein
MTIVLWIAAYAALVMWVGRLLGNAHACDDTIRQQLDAVPLAFDTPKRRRNARSSAAPAA